MAGKDAGCASCHLGNKQAIQHLSTAHCGPGGTRVPGGIANTYAVPPGLQRDWASEQALTPADRPHCEHCMPCLHIFLQCVTKPFRNLSCPLVPSRAVPSHALSCPLLPSRALSCCALPCPLVPSRALPRALVLCPLVLCPLMPSHALSCCALPCPLMPSRALPRALMLCPLMLCPLMPSHALSCPPTRSQPGPYGTSHTFPCTPFPHAPQLICAPVSRCCWARAGGGPKHNALPCFPGLPSAHHGGRGCAGRRQVHTHTHHHHHHHHHLHAVQCNCAAHAAAAPPHPRAKDPPRTGAPLTCAMCTSWSRWPSPRRRPSSAATSQSSCGPAAGRAVQGGGGACQGRVRVTGPAL